MNLVCVNCKGYVMLIECEELEQDEDGNYFYVTEQHCSICGLRLKTKLMVEIVKS